MAEYKITNYGNTRTVYVRGRSWEISKNATITVDEVEIPEAEEVAEAFAKLPFVDVEVVKQPAKKVAAKKKTIAKKTKKKKVATKIRKKTKRRKVKRRKK